MEEEQEEIPLMGAQLDLVLTATSEGKIVHWLGARLLGNFADAQAAPGRRRPIAPPRRSPSRHLHLSQRTRGRRTYRTSPLDGHHRTVAFLH